MAVATSQVCRSPRGFFVPAGAKIFVRVARREAGGQQAEAIERNSTKTTCIIQHDDLFRGYTPYDLLITRYNAMHCSCYVALFLSYT